MTPKNYLRALLRAIDLGEMPRGLDVELYWRNPETVNGRSLRWQSGEFTEVIQDSSAGFGSIVRRAIQRRLLR